MSKGLKKAAAKLERKAAQQTALIRQAVGQYSQSVDSEIDCLRRKREIERIVGRYLRIHKSLRQIRKKMGAAVR
ncbi:MAG: hypothetical protein AB1631_33395 [Acidobacteriota bacterium]